MDDPFLTHTPGPGVVCIPEPFHKSYPHIALVSAPDFLLAIVPRNIGMSGPEITGNLLVLNGGRNAVLALAGHLGGQPRGSCRGAFGRRLGGGRAGA